MKYEHLRRRLAQGLLQQLNSDPLSRRRLSTKFTYLFFSKLEKKRRLFSSLQKNNFYMGLHQAKKRRFFLNIFLSKTVKNFYRSNFKFNNLYKLKFFSFHLNQKKNSLKAHFYYARA